jgi:hypothetical protein
MELKQTQNLKPKQIPANPKTNTKNKGSYMCDRTETKWTELKAGRPKTVRQLF